MKWSNYEANARPMLKLVKLGVCSKAARSHIPQEE